VAHAEADAVFLGAAVVAVGAGRAFLVERRGLLLWRHRVAAGTAENLVTFAKTVGDGDALVEDKARALPEAILLGNILQVFQNSTLEMVDILITLVRA
jgi:hypothetical protein